MSSGQCPQNENITLDSKPQPSGFNLPNSLAKRQSPIPQATFSFPQSPALCCSARACEKWEIPTEGPQKCSWQSLAAESLSEALSLSFFFFFFWKPEKYIYSAKLFSQYLLIEDILYDEHCNFWVNSTKQNAGPSLLPVGGKPH